MLKEKQKDKEDFRQEHGGDIRAIAGYLNVVPELFIDFSANINPFGPPPEVLEAGKISIGQAYSYPDLNAQSFIEALSANLKVDQDRLVPGNGSADLLYWLMAWIKPQRVMVAEPCFSDYRRAAEANGGKVVSIRLIEENGFDLDWAQFETMLESVDLAVIGRPNNPTGNLFDAGKLLDIAARQPRTIFVIDEAFIDFVDDAPGQTLAHARSKNIIVLRSLTKMFSIPGIRLGYLIADKERTAAIREARQPWPLGDGQIAAGCAALKLKGFVESSRERLAAERCFLHNELNSIAGLKAFPSAANFILVRLQDSGIDSQNLMLAMAERGVYIRDCSSFAGLIHDYFRVAVRSREDNKKLTEKLKEIL